MPPRLFIQLGEIDLDLLKCIEIEAEKRRQEEEKHGARADASGGASQPIPSGKRQAGPTKESQEACAAREMLNNCRKTLWRLRLGRVEGQYACHVCRRVRPGMGSVAREHCVLDSVRWTAFFP